MITAELVALALLCGALDPVEVATRHEKAGRRELALHLLDRITNGKGDASAQAIRARLLSLLGRHEESRASAREALASGAKDADLAKLAKEPVVASVAPAKPPSVRASGPAPVLVDPIALFKESKYLEAAPLLRARLESNATDFTTFSYLTGCYWYQAGKLVGEGKLDEARKAYAEGKRIEQMYGPNFPDLAGTTAPDDLVKRFGP